MSGSDDTTETSESCFESYFEPDRINMPPLPRDARFSLEGLAKTIESEIIPRLLMSHGPLGQQQVKAEVPRGSIGHYVKQLLDHDSARPVAYVESERARGVSDETILLDLLAPAARLLGDMWVDDKCDFVDVTLGLGRMQQMLRALRPGGDVQEGGRRMLLVPAPGEQHIFGLRMVEEFMIRAGWNVRCNVKATETEIIDLVQSESYDIVGFSISGETLIEPLASTIRNVRRRAANPGMCVMVGGVRIAEQPGLAVSVGADVEAADAPEAVRRANAWLKLS
jgi:MerR family transcriptional regulator, light-induced transcriptional regulator